MDLADAFQRLQDSELFKAFAKEHPDAYLAHGFVMEDSPDDGGIWLFGYYSTKRDRITVFEIAKEIKQAPEDEVFKKQGVVKQLSLEGALSFADAKKIAMEVKEDHYPHKLVAKTMAILQHIPLGTVWNITLITQDFYLINLKLDAKTGKVKHESCDSILSLKKED